MTNSRSKIVHLPLPQDDPRQRQPDIARAKETLGWEPRTGLTEGLVQTIAYFDGMIAEGLVQKVMEPT
jgi:UDP-glucuronate decarboxylase